MFQIPRGTRDFTPKEMDKRRYVEESMKKTFTTFGYREIQTPLFEHLELFTAKSGEGIVDELYSFEDKSGRQLALRPELTAPVIRFYVDRLQMEPKPLKLCYFGNCFRYDRPQKGRYREFWQAGCEIIGTNTAEAYAELIALAYYILKNVGVQQIQLCIGNLTILSSIFTQFHLSEEDQKKLTPLIDKAQYDEVSLVLEQLGVDQQKIHEFLDVLQTSDTKKIQQQIKGDAAAEKEFIFLETVLDFLKHSFHINDYQIKLSIVRGLDYYSGLVFEIDAPVLGAEKQLCGGGVYELLSLFGGTPTSTAGFAIGFDRTILALETEQFSFPSRHIDVYIIPVNEDMIPIALEIAYDLRKEGIVVDIDLLRRGVGKSLKYANSVQATKAILVGPKELEKQALTLRNLETGEQHIVPRKKIVSTLQQ